MITMEEEYKKSIEQSFKKAYEFISMAKLYVCEDKSTSKTLKKETKQIKEEMRDILIDETYDMTTTDKYIRYALLISDSLKASLRTDIEKITDLHPDVRSLESIVEKVRMYVHDYEDDKYEDYFFNLASFITLTLEIEKGNFEIRNGILNSVKNSSLNAKLNEKINKGIKETLDAVNSLLIVHDRNQKIMNSTYEARTMQNSLSKYLEENKSFLEYNKPARNISSFIDYATVISRKEYSVIMFCEDISNISKPTKELFRCVATVFNVVYGFNPRDDMNKASNVGYVCSQVNEEECYWNDSVEYYKCLAKFFLFVAKHMEKKYHWDT